MVLCAAMVLFAVHHAALAKSLIPAVTQLCGKWQHRWLQGVASGFDLELLYTICCSLVAKVVVALTLEADLLYPLPHRATCQG